MDTSIFLPETFCLGKNTCRRSIWANLEIYFNIDIIN